jgi:hypothetical protein
LILDDVAHNGLRKIGRAKLLWEWSLHKIRRDIAKRSRDGDLGWQFELDFSQRLMRMMEDVAMVMTERTADGLALLESTDAKEPEVIAARYFPSEPDLILKVVLNSLLIPHGLFEDGRFTVHFVYRAFHEFFVACYAVRNGQSVTAPGTEIAYFTAELKSENFAWTTEPPQRLL